MTPFQQYCFGLIKLTHLLRYIGNPEICSQSLGSALDYLDPQRQRFFPVTKIGSLSSSINQVVCHVIAHSSRHPFAASCEKFPVELVEGTVLCIAFDQRHEFRGGQHDGIVQMPQSQVGYDL